MLNKITVLVFIVGIFLNTVAQESKESDGKFSGYMFGDYYYFIDNHKTELKDKNGFQFRRIYFTYDHKIDKSFSTRLRFELANEFDFEDASKITPFVKDAYLKYKFSNHQLILGISSTPNKAIVEKIWGYRSVEKTPLDLQKFASSRDFGLALKGQLDENGTIRYHAMFGNGSSNKNEVDRGKSGMLAISFYPAKQIIIELYGDYSDKPGENDWYTLQGFLAFVTDKFRAGIQFAQQTRKDKAAEDIKLEIASLFLTGKLSENVSLLGRIDRNFDPNPSGEKIDYIPFDKHSKSTLFIAGIDWHPVKNVSFIPNVEIVKYDENSSGIAPESDVLAKLTFFWKFK